MFNWVLAFDALDCEDFLCCGAYDILLSVVVFVNLLVGNFINAEGNKDVIFMSYIKSSVRIGIVLLVATCVSGCANFSKKKEPASNKYITQVSKLEKEVKDLATQNSVLKSALKKPKKSVQPENSPTVVLNTKEVSGEHSLYTAALEAYWARDIEKLKRLNSMLIKTYPKSVHADNSLYLQASLQYSQGALGESLQTLNRIVKDYPNSNKFVSAELMKAMIFSRLNLAEQSNEIYLRISKNYPGSPEARQASLQLSVITPPVVATKTITKKVVK